MRIAVMALALSACVSGTSFVTPPQPIEPARTSVTVLLAPDSAWTILVSRLVERSFVISGLDRASGLLIVDYDGDADRHLDCGTFTSDVEDDDGRTAHYEFPAASPYQRLEVVTGSDWDDEVIAVTWRTSLQARASIVLEPLGEEGTRMTVSTRYVMTHTWAPDGAPPNVTTAVLSAGRAGSTEDGFITCHPTGTLERDLLGLLRDVR